MATVYDGRMRMVRAGLPRTRRSLLVVIAMLVAVAVAIVVVVMRDDAPQSPDEAVTAYVEALNDSDADRLVELAGRHMNSTSAARARVRQLGGQDIRLTSVDIELDGITENIGTARLVGNGKRGRYSETIRLAADEFGDWSISLGSVKDPIPSSAGTKRP